MIKPRTERCGALCCGAVGTVLYLGAQNLVTSRTGRAIMAIRDNPTAARSMGINTGLYKSLTFGVSALYNGVAGAIGAPCVVAELRSGDRGHQHHKSLSNKRQDNLYVLYY